MLGVVRFTSKIWHEDVVYIEVRRGEGIEGGDVINVGVEAEQQGYTGYYMAPSVMQRINKYRLRCKVSWIEIQLDSELKDYESDIVVREGNRIAFNKIGDSHPTVLLILEHGKECRLKIVVKKPKSLPYAEEKIP